MRRHHRRAGLAVLLVALSIGVGDGRIHVADASVSATTIAKVQSGSIATGPTGATATLATASTAGNLLVATVAAQASTAFTAPSGWARGPSTTASNAHAEVWYYANNPGGITSATFTSS